MTDCVKSRLATCLCWRRPAAPSLIIHVVTSAVSSHVSRAEREGPHQLQEKHPRFPRPASHHHPGPGRIAVKTGDTPDILSCGMMRSRRYLLNRNGRKNEITTSLPFPLLVDHVSGRNSRRVWAEVGHGRRCLRLYEATVTGVGGMG